MSGYACDLLAKFGIGQPVPRTEDPTLVQGQGRYTDDIDLPGQAYAVIVRSRHAHGVIKSDRHRSGARRCRACSASIPAPIVEAGYGTFKCIVPFKNRDGSEMKKPDAPRARRRQGALRRRSGRLRGRGDLAAGEGRRRSGRARYRSAARGDARKRSREARRAAALSTTCRAMSRSIIITATPRKSRPPSRAPRM